MLVTSSLGLNRGMVLDFDHDGHWVLDSAHAVHDRTHEDGDHHEDPADPHHQDLHAAMAAVDAGRVQQQRFAGSSEHEVAGPVFAIHSLAIFPEPVLSPPVCAAGPSPNHFWGSTARVHLLCISATVLLV